MQNTSTSIIYFCKITDINKREVNWCGFSIHILSNSMQHWMDTFYFDVQPFVTKMCNHFSAQAGRTNSLQIRTHLMQLNICSLTVRKDVSYISCSKRVVKNVTCVTLLYFSVTQYFYNYKISKKSMKCIFGTSTTPLGVKQMHSQY